MTQQECCCLRLCRSWTLSWWRAAGMQTVKSAEMMSFPDGFLLISTSDRGMRSPCEPLLPPFHLNLDFLLARFILPTWLCFLSCIFRGSDNMNPTGQVKLTIGYSTEEARLFITVHACRFLLLSSLTSHVSSWSTDHQKMLCLCFTTPPPSQSSGSMLQGWC